MMFTLLCLSLYLSVHHCTLTIPCKKHIHSKYRHDGFGFAVAARNNVLVTGGPANNSNEGYVSINGVDIHNPNPKEISGFGYTVALSKDYVFVSSLDRNDGGSYHSIYVYSTAFPHKFVRKIQFKNESKDDVAYQMAVNDANTIVLGVISEKGSQYSLLIFEYTGSRSMDWRRMQKINLPSDGELGMPLIRIANDLMAVEIFPRRGLNYILLYKRTDGNWDRIQRIDLTTRDIYLPTFLSMEGGRLAISTKNLIKIYKYNEGKWKLGSQIAHRGMYDSFITIDKDILAIVSPSKRENKVYKMKMIGGQEKWFEHAKLNMVWHSRGKGDVYYNTIDGDLVFTVFMDPKHLERLGMIWIHDISPQGI